MRMSSILQDRVYILNQCPLYSAVFQTDRIHHSSEFLFIHLGNYASLLDNFRLCRYRYSGFQGGYAPIRRHFKRRLNLMLWLPSLGLLMLIDEEAKKRVIILAGHHKAVQVPLYNGGKQVYVWHSGDLLGHYLGTPMPSFNSKWVSTAITIAFWGHGY